MEDRVVGPRAVSRGTTRDGRGDVAAIVDGTRVMGWAMFVAKPRRGGGEMVMGAVWDGHGD